MIPRDCDCSAKPLLHPQESLFERCSWFYALCREHLFHDHTPEIARSLFPRGIPAPGTHLLEVGCGPGFYACRLAQAFPQLQTTGVDLSRCLLRRAQLRARRLALRNCHFCQGDACALPRALGHVDALIASRLFLIVPNRAARESVVREIFRVLRPGGRCFIAEPTSALRACIPLGCMWILSRFPASATGFREPHRAGILSRRDFSTLIHSQPWASVLIEHDATYQYAVCQKTPDQSPDTLPEVSAAINPKKTPETIPEKTPDIIPDTISAPRLPALPTLSK